MNANEFEGRIQAVVEMWRRGSMKETAMERVAELSDQLKLTTQLTQSIESKRCAEIGEGLL